MIRRLLFWRRSRTFAADLQRELDFHVESRTDALIDEGWSRESAARQARLELGGAAQIHETSRDVWLIRWVDHLGRDLRYALRGWRRRPGFATAVIATLALGIGANTAIFSLVDAWLLQPPPFRDSGRLVLVHASRPSVGQLRIPLSYPNFVDLREQAKAFEAVSGWIVSDGAVTGGNAAPEQVQVALVTANLFDVLGAPPAIGRPFAASEDRPGTPPVAVISHGLWMRRFAGDRSALGRTVTVNGRPYQVVGVAGEGFAFPGAPHGTDVWLPFGLDWFADRRFVRGLNDLFAIGRLRPGLTLDEGRDDVSSVASTLAQAYPDNNRDRLMVLMPLAAQAGERVRWALVALSGAVVLVLLVACVNVVNLLLGRASARRHELAMRSALGASRRRIAAQLVVEYVAFGIAGGAGAVAVAALARPLLSRLPYSTPDLFTPWLPPVNAIAMNTHVRVFTSLVSLGVGLAIGVLPALRVHSRQALDRHPLRARAALIVSEIAMAVVLLAGMGLMLGTLSRLTAINPGFAPEGLTTVGLSLSPAKYRTSAQMGSFYDRLIDGVSRLPGVTSAGVVEFLPLSGFDADTGLLFEGPIPPQDRRPRIHFRSASSDYLATMGIPVVAGRGFTTADGVDRRVAMVNESAVRLLFPDGRPLGRKIALDFEAMKYFPDRPPEFDLSLGLREIVGVTRDVHHSGLAADAEPEMFVPMAQRPVRRMTLVVRSPLAPEAMLASLRHVVSGLDPDLPLTAASSVSDLVAASISQPRVNAMLLSAFGVLAFILAGIGVYGVMSYFVQVRTRDIGIRMAIGATRSDVLRLVLGRMVGLTAAGLGIGLAGALAAGAGLSRVLDNVPPSSGVVLAIVSVLIVLLTATAALIPALRATRVDPVRAIRGE